MKTEKTEYSDINFIHQILTLQKEKVLLPTRNNFNDYVRSINDVNKDNKITTTEDLINAIRHDLSKLDCKTEDIDQIDPNSSLYKLFGSSVSKQEIGATIRLLELGYVTIKDGSVEKCCQSYDTATYNAYFDQILAAEYKKGIDPEMESENVKTLIQNSGQYFGFDPRKMQRRYEDFLVSAPSYKKMKQDEREARLKKEHQEKFEKEAAEKVIKDARKKAELEAKAKQAKGCDRDLVDALIDFQVKSIKDFSALEQVHHENDASRASRYKNQPAKKYDKYIMFINDILENMEYKENGIQCTEVSVDKMFEIYQQWYVVKNSELDKAILKGEHIGEIKSILQMLLDKGYIYHANGGFRSFFPDIEHILKAEYAKINNNNVNDVGYLQDKANKLYTIHQEMIDNIQEDLIASELCWYSPAYDYDNDTKQCCFAQLQKPNLITGNEQTSLVNNMITIMVSKLDELDKTRQKRLKKERIENEQLQKDRRNDMYLTSVLSVITAIAIAVPIINRGALSTYMPVGMLNDAARFTRSCAFNASEYIANNTRNSYNFMQQTLSSLLIRD